MTQIIIWTVIICIVFSMFSIALNIDLIKELKGWQEEIWHYEHLKENIKHYELSLIYQIRETKKLNSKIKEKDKEIVELNNEIFELNREIVERNETIVELSRR